MIKQTDIFNYTLGDSFWLASKNMANLSLLGFLLIDLIQKVNVKVTENIKKPSLKEVNINHSKSRYYYFEGNQQLCQY